MKYNQKSLCWLRCSCVAFTRNGDVKAGSAGGVLLFLGVYLGKFAGLAVQLKLGEVIAELGKEDLCSGNYTDGCQEYIGLIMWLIAVVFGSGKNLNFHLSLSLIVSLLKHV